MDTCILVDTATEMIARIILRKSHDEVFLVKGEETTKISHSQTLEASPVVFSKGSIWIRSDLDFDKKLRQYGALLFSTVDDISIMAKTEVKL